jgi:hypothetical protein
VNDPAEPTLLDAQIGTAAHRRISGKGERTTFSLDLAVSSTAGPIVLSGDASLYRTFPDQRHENIDNQ